MRLFDDDSGAVPVRVSGAQARQRFHGCEPAYIRDVCRAACCRSTTAPTGMIVTIHPDEVRRIERRGGVVVDGLLQPTRVDRPRRCPFQNELWLCDLHLTADKPFGCIASPFTLTSTGRVLVVRNRYRLLRCYRDDRDGPAPPAYRAFRASLDLIFGPDESARVCQRLDDGDPDVAALMPRRSWDVLRKNDTIKKEAG